jgi:aminomuconate-semialdehyde/2-hydroxymuconate-6-semialdehyde dehydrogenase
MLELLNFIGGEFKPPLANRWLEVHDPAQGSVFARLADSDSETINAAITAAESAFPAWAALDPESRANILNRIADLIEERLLKFAEAESKDTGKPLLLAQSVDIPRAARNFRFFASGLQHFASEAHASPGFLNYTLRQPLGVVACISPWNLPLYLLTWKIAPALAAGNTVIAKPSEITSYTAFLLAKICQEAGLPAGVLNIVMGSGYSAGAALVADPRIKAISFTGSTRTGAEIARVAAPQFKKLSLEMGGKNAALIFADCEYEKCLETILRAAFSNQGQICLCMSRILIEKSLYQRFKHDFVALTQALVVGDPLLPESRLGALVSQEHLEKVKSYVDLAQQEGGQILCGGQTLNPPGRCSQGWFFSPTVIEGLSGSCRTNQEEIFGPVVSLIPFSDESEALALANGSEYGLAASVWTSNTYRVQRLSESLQTGLVWINCWMERDLRTPFGGTKNSGLGREGGWEALRFFTEPKNVCLAQ